MRKFHLQILYAVFYAAFWAIGLTVGEHIGYTKGMQSRDHEVTKLHSDIELAKKNCWDGVDTYGSLDLGRSHPVSSKKGTPLSVPLCPPPRIRSSR